MVVDSKVEKRAIEFIEKNRSELIDFTIRLIEIPTQNPPGNELAAARIAATQMRKLGLTDLQIIEAHPKRANLICNFETGQPGKKLLLNGHLDTKQPVPISEWNTDPYQGIIQDEKLFGLGSADMKGPDAALVFGLAAAKQAGDKSLKGNVLLVLSADEEQAAVHGARFLVQQKGRMADAVLIAEPIGITRPWECIPLISRGVSCIRWFVKGTQTHSSISDRIHVVNASLEASRLMVFLSENLRLTYPETQLCPKGPTINMGATIKGGQAYAMVSGNAEFVADIRTLPGMTKEQLKNDIEDSIEAFRKQRPGVEVTWDFFPGTLGWTQPTIISPEEPIVQAVCSAAEEVLGFCPPFGYFPGGTDAIWWQGAAGIPTIPGFGPGLLTNCHKPNEYIVTEEIIQAAKIYALTVLNYLTRE